jgi:hypothetical protein
MHGVLSFFWFLSVSLSFSRFATITFLLPAWLIGYRLATTFEPTCPISPPTPPALAPCRPPLNPLSSPCPLSFFVPSRHWNWCFDGSGRLFRAVYVCAGPPQSPLHTFTTTFLALFSFFVCAQSSGKWTQLSTLPFGFDAAKAQNKV